MQPRKIALVALLIGALPVTYVLGQQNAAPDVQAFDKDLENATNSLSTQQWAETLTGAQKMASLSQKAVGDRARSQAVVTQAMARFYSDGDRKAEIRLQALQVAQNQRIIELLEQLNAKKN
ncbi:hypothetical protein EON83_25920 [bacterium]|nr:MAG: hypothetical protein EON83_25920 [bacterium]